MEMKKRLIDARFLKSQMYMICEVCQTENIFIDAIIDEIDNAPDEDAVVVVRCGKCKWYDTESACCKFWHGSRSPSHYCGEGKVKDNELV